MQVQLLSSPLINMTQHSVVPMATTIETGPADGVAPGPVSASPAGTAASEVVLVLDFGGQTAQLIARRVREQNVFCQLVRPGLSADRIREIRPRGLILSGGPASVYDVGAPLPDPRIFELGIPILGICYGMQAACRALGNEVSPGTHREFGRTSCRVLANRTVADGDLFRGVPSELTVWMSHGDQVKNLSDQWIPLASTADCPAAAVRHHSLPIYCLQFHPEVTHVPSAVELCSGIS